GPFASPPERDDGEPACERREPGRDPRHAADGGGAEQEGEWVEEDAGAGEPGVVLDERPQRGRDLLPLLQREREMLGEILALLRPVGRILGEAAFDGPAELARYADVPK